MQLEAFRHEPVTSPEFANLPPEKLSYRALTLRIALLVIKHNHEIFKENISWLKDSPILKLAPDIDGIDSLSSTVIHTATDDKKVKAKQFDIAMTQFLTLAHVKKNAITTFLVKKGLTFIKNTLVDPVHNASNYFERNFVKDHQKVLNSEIPEEDTINGEKGVYPHFIDFEHKSSHDSIHKLKLGVAMSLVHFLRNQANVGGHINQKLYPDKDYRNKIKESYFGKPEGNPPFMKINWRVICKDSPLIDELEKLYPTIAASSDNDASDQTAYFPENSSEPMIDHPAILIQGIDAIKIRVISKNGKQFSDIPASLFLQTSDELLTKNLHAEPSSSNSPYKWHDNKSLQNPKEQASIISIAINPMQGNTPDSTIKSKSTHFLTLQLDNANKKDTLIWESGHLRIDGAARKEVVDAFSQLIESSIIPATSDILQIETGDKKSLPSVSKDQLLKANNLQEILTLLNLRKVIIGTRFDSHHLKYLVEEFNLKFLEAHDKELALFVEKDEVINKLISTLLHQNGDLLERKRPKLKENEDASSRFKKDVIKQICATLNPHVALSDILAVTSEDTTSSATCALPVSPLRRLVTHIADSINLKIRSISESFRLTSVERTLAKMGLGWQSYLAVSVDGKESLTQRATKPLNKRMIYKSKARRQFSDIGESKSKNYFVTALSALIDELAAGVGISGDFITERIDFRKADFVNDLKIATPFSDFELDQVNNLLLNTKNPINLPYKKLQILNDILKNRIKPNSSGFDVFKKILTIKAISNPSEYFTLLLIASAYRELSNIPIQANNYLNQALME